MRISDWSSDVCSSDLSGLSHSFSHLAASRVLMGAAEPGAFPVVQRAILNWVPIERRALAISIATPAGNIGAILAPPLIALLATVINWRAAFVIPGAIGIGIAILRSEEHTSELQSLMRISYAV